LDNKVVLTFVVVDWVAKVKYRVVLKTPGCRLGVEVVLEIALGVLFKADHRFDLKADL
jgi:hypothetical protein